MRPIDAQHILDSTGRSQPATEHLIASRNPAHRVLLLAPPPIPASNEVPFILSQAVAAIPSFSSGHQLLKHMHLEALQRIN